MKNPDGPRFSIDPKPQKNGKPDKYGWTIYHPNGKSSGKAPIAYYNRDLAVKSVNHHLRNCLHLAASKIYGDPE